jgi:hypothetical protein
VVFYTNTTSLIRTLTNTSPTKPESKHSKKRQTDFESTHFQDTLYIFGSGSTTRNAMIEFDLKTNKKTMTNNLVDLYAVMQSFGYIKSEDFNLEGVTYDGENWYLFNRGNSDIQECPFHFTPKIKPRVQPFFKRLQAPKMKGSYLFTDAVLVDEKIYFLATAENTTYTYDDGEILGSLIGRIDIEMKIDFTKN